MKAWLALFWILLAGCANQGWSHNLYEGVKARQDADAPLPPEPGARKMQSYDDYEKERRALATPGTP